MLDNLVFDNLDGPQDLIIVRQKIVWLSISVSLLILDYCCWYSTCVSTATFMFAFFSFLDAIKHRLRRN